MLRTPFVIPALTSTPPQLRSFDRDQAIAGVVPLADEQQVSQSIHHVHLRRVNSTVDTRVHAGFINQMIIRRFDMAKIIPLRSAAVPTARRTGLRGWIDRMRSTVDRLVYQLIRIPSGRAGSQRKAGHDEKGQGSGKDNARR
ncbi:hypothetical protein [Pseudomonas sp. D(2018)]|uniref:hypothetical protein n=1 Tax=Pseudomonas sp. D(2018) TaxID=2502238 RepID=UPI0010F8B8C3|nr:hypothetical protein [Pseudomonas sp. D(2018)]